MTLSSPPATACVPRQLLTPLLLPEGMRLTPEQFASVCAANPDAVLELNSDGRLIAMTPTGSETSARNSTLLILLGLAVQRSALPFKIFDSSGGFLLPDGSVRSPDVSLVRLERWQALSQEQRRGFAPLCPDLVVELVSPCDAGPRGGKALRQKMAAYRANGAQLGWLLLPDEQAVEIWRADQPEPDRIKPASQLDGADLFPGLVIDLAEIWAV